MIPARAAVLDVGSLSVLLAVGERGPDGRLVLLREEARVARLGEGLVEGGRLDAEAAARTSAVVREMAALARKDGATTIRAAGTAALRAARDAEAFAARVRAEAGLELDVVSPAREAALTLAGVRTGRTAGGPFAVLDVGGGSAEIVVETATRIRWESLPLGALRLASRYAEDDLDALAAHVDGLLPPFPGGGAPADWTPVGVGGTITTLGALDLGLTPYDGARLEGHRLSLDRLATIRRELRATPIGARRADRVIERGRADVVVHGTLVYERMLARYGWDGIEISPRGLREGLLAETLGIGGVR